MFYIVPCGSKYFVPFRAGHNIHIYSGSRLNPYLTFRWAFLSCHCICHHAEVSVFIIILFIYMFHIHTIMTYKMEWYWTAILVEYSLIVWNCSHNKPGVTCKTSHWHFSFRQIIFGWLLCTNVDTLDRQSVTSRHHSLIYSDYTAAESTPVNINLSSSLFWGIQLH